MTTDVLFILSATLNCFIIYVCLEDWDCVKMFVNPLSWFCTSATWSGPLLVPLNSLRAFSLDSFRRQEVVTLKRCVQCSVFFCSGGVSDGLLTSLLKNDVAWCCRCVRKYTILWPFSNSRHWWYLENYSVFMSVFSALIHWFLPSLNRTHMQYLLSCRKMLYKVGECV